MTLAKEEAVLSDLLTQLHPSADEVRFDAFLKEQQLHHTQAEAGLGWVDRNISRSARYSHSAALDVVNPALRTLMPNMLGQRGLFRFMFAPRDRVAQEPHLAVSDRQLRIPGLNFRLPKNPLLHLDIAAFLLLTKGRALRFLDSMDVPATPVNVTTVLAVWFARSDDNPPAVDEPPEPLSFDYGGALGSWLRDEAPPYLVLHKFGRPAKWSASGLTLPEAQEAKGIPAHRLATLYPPQSEAE